MDYRDKPHTRLSAMELVFERSAELKKKLEALKLVENSKHVNKLIEETEELLRTNIIMYQVLK